MTAEHEIQNRIRLEISKRALGTLFRANVGQGWTGDSFIKLSNGDVVIHHGRRFTTGLPVGFPDIFGFREIEITPDMVGNRIAVFVALEIKTQKGRVSQKQQDMLTYLRAHHAIAGVTRSVEDAVRILSEDGAINFNQSGWDNDGHDMVR